MALHRIRPVHMCGPVLFIKRSSVYVSPPSQLVVASPQPFRNDGDRARRDRRRGHYDPSSSGLHSPPMLPAARGLPSSFRAGLRPCGRLLISQSLPIPRSSSTLNASRQLSSTRPQSAKYVRFEVDPEQPLNYRRWSTGTQVFGGIVVLSVFYYVSQYAPSFARPPHAPDYMSVVLKPCQKRVDGDLWTSVQNSRPGYAWITTMNHATNVPSDGEGVSRATPRGISRQNSPTESPLNTSGLRHRYKDIGSLEPGFPKSGTSIYPSRNLNRGLVACRRAQQGGASTWQRG